MQKRLIAIALIVLAIIIIVIATWMPFTSTSNLEEKKWYLTSYGDVGNPKNVLPDTEITAIFSNGSITGSAGCNNYFGQYEVDGSSLKIGENLGVTMMMCQEDVMQQETEFLSALQKARSFCVTGNTLEITHEGGKLILISS